MSRAEQMVKEVFKNAGYIPLAQKIFTRYARETRVERNELWVARQALGIKRFYVEHPIDGSRVLMWLWPKEEK